MLREVRRRWPKLWPWLIFAAGMIVTKLLIEFLNWYCPQTATGCGLGR